MAKQTFTVGQKVTFTGYTELGPDQPEILQVGTEYKVIEDKGDNTYVVTSRDGSQADTVFDDEIAPVDTKTKSVRKSTKTTATKTETGRTKAKTPAKANTPKSNKTTAKSKSKTKTEQKVPEPSQEIATLLPEQISDSSTVKAILESKDMLEAARELAVAAEETFISLGGVLNHIYDTGAHKVLGYDGKRGFADYMLKELNIHYRKGMYLIEIYNVARRYDLDERILAEIGWSKMKEIASKVTAENAEELLTFARDHTREELVEHVRTTMVKAGTERVEKVSKTVRKFVLFGDQDEIVARALDAASRMIDNPTPEGALQLICAEWSQFTEGVTLSVEQAVEALSLRFGAETVASAVTAVENKSEQTVELEHA